MEKYSWNFNKDAENWYNDPCNTIGECLVAAREAESAEEEPRSCVYIGENVAFVPTVDAETVLEQIACEAYDFCELAEDWDIYDRKKQDELNDLSEQLTSVVQAWLKKYKREPSFWRVESVRRYIL
ncbi:hypothetical protein [Faecalispora jeddahensis]|uniref:hypothetical protein n=1 Tax=Faecalispora jeddahensis TaxID=1414721 RepID=UPI0028A94BCF|nr:hypothetical protein [Faecalispora jeddahensis]